MAFRIRERESDEDTAWIAEWPFPARKTFIESRAYEVLLREADRYVSGDVPGRSFLISGHRGSGKTSLVRQVVEDLSRIIFERADQDQKRAAAASGPARKSALRLQRPLLVKLHGPGLLGPVKRPKAKTAEADQKGGAKKEVDSGAAKKKDSAAAATPATTAAPAEPESSELVDQTAFALEQITIALYRALVAEFSKSFANQVRLRLAEEPAHRAGDFLELTGQFTLDLDNAPRAAVLRDYYARLGRIESGLLWPSDFSKELLAGGQGIREIVALATAAQAFEICSGDITDKQTLKDTRSRDETAETRTEAGLKDVANKLLGLGAGVGVGVATASTLGWLGGALAGVMTGLVSTLTLSWTSKRSRKDERILDYTFIRRRDRETLERDLPLVIQRVRDAGLAPVFVVDELDKLKDPKKSIADLINSLKHLTTDYGFFCFLTDRDYYDYVARKVAREAFPVEHSFFSHRMFILHQPKQLLEYLGRITQNDTSAAPGAASPTPADPAEEDAARSSFGLLVLHRSKLNLIEILRKIAEECDSAGRVLPSSLKLRSDHGYRFAASVQLVIGLLLRQTAMRERVENESRFVQRAVDALYMLSRAWEDEERRVQLDRGAIVKCLLERSGRIEITQAAEPTAANGNRSPARPAAAGATRRADKRRSATAKVKIADPPSQAQEAEENRKAEADLLQTGMSVRDLDLVDQAVGLLAEMLSDIERLKSWIATELGPDPEPAALATILPPGNLVVCRQSERRIYEFLVDVYGQDLRTQEALRPAPPSASAASSAIEPDAGGGAPPQASGRGTGAASVLPDALAGEITNALDFLENLESALTAAGVSIAELVRLQIFPPVDPAELVRAAGQLRDAVRTARPHDGLAKDLPLISSLVTFVSQHGKALSALLRLSACVARAARSPMLRVAEAIPAIGRYLDLRGAFSSTSAGPWSAIVDPPFRFDDSLFSPGGDAASVLSWRDQFVAWRDLDPPGLFYGPDRAVRIWVAAAERVSDHFNRGSSALVPLYYDYIVGAAAGAPPGSALRHDLRQMTAADWSTLCLAGYPRARDREGPLWAFIAGLCALGFNRRILQSAASLPRYFGDQDRIDLCEQLTRGAMERSEPGYILIMRDDGVSIGDSLNYLRLNLAQDVVTPVLVLPERALEAYSEALGWLRMQGAITRLIYEEAE